MNLRIGISPCPNDVFIFSGLLHGTVKTDWTATFAFEDVETLNQRARAGAFDLVKISYANARHCSAYHLLRCGGALGRGCGPLLLTGGAPFDPKVEILVPGENTTANFLLDFWAGQSLRKRFLPFDALYRELRERREAQGVVIHEMRFTYARDGLRLERDLGAHWEEATGHPIPLGALAYRPAAGPASESIEDAVRQSLDWAYAHQDETLQLCARHAQSMDPAVLRAHVQLYVNEYTRDLGDTGTRAVAFFLQRLRAG